MKYGNFISRAVCLLLILVAMGRFQAKASLKAQKEEENAAAIAKIETENREIRNRENKAGQNGDPDSGSPYKDGSFEAEAEGFGGPIRVAVTIEGGDITKVEVVEAAAEDPAYFSQARAVIDEILSTQGVNVDTVSGATFSSTGLINAVTEALRSALK